MEKLCNTMDWTSWTLDERIALCVALERNQEQIHAAATQRLIRTALYLPILEYTVSPLPRLFMDGLIRVAQVAGKPVLDGLIVPLLLTDNIKHRPLTQVVTKLIQSALSPTLRLLLLRAVLSDGDAYGHSGTLMPWSDPVVQILEKTLSSPPLLSLEGPLAQDLVLSLRSIVHAHPKHKGSMQLLLLLTNKYPQPLVEHQLLDAVQDAASTSTMFLKKSVLAQVANIRKKLTR
ncbi:hypothetical protein BCR43DRAFT_438356 [Syncephalastrum racemosum]|uniref:Fanconi Anaemia group E protein C-terminal domain-containing protein n=1 Tax=Syncephalastrum racemosum TaxID=13706 RepID=A0A1X2HGK9_SYNRA|nr:hypothetical protein BCR43DRAFT_438356 [Syncephalastrum racemosum]